MSKKPVILCVDDERVILQSLKSQTKDLFGSKYTFEAAETGESAIEIIDELLAEGYEIPLVVVDYLMPGTRGDRVLIEIHSRTPSTLCIMLTGQADLSAVANAINHEALFRFMSKPWNKEDLFKTISEAFHRYDLEKTVVEKQNLLESQNLILASLNQQLTEKIQTFSKFVPAEFLRLLNVDMNRDHISLGESCQKEVAVLFTDIRGFTDATQTFSNKETFNFVNSFTSLIAPIINKNSGFVDKYIGDAVLSIFLDVNDALSAIFESQAALQALPESSSLHNIKLGFSLNFGSVQMGTVGYSGRMETTILGKVVNVAAKLEKLNKKYHTSIIVTEDACQMGDKSRFSFIPLDGAVVEGVNEQIKIFTVAPNNDSASNSL